MSLNPNGDARKHREFILVWAIDALRLVRGSEPIALNPRVLVVGAYKLATGEGVSPRSRLGGCECERILSSRMSSRGVCVNG